MTKIQAVGRVTSKIASGHGASLIVALKGGKLDRGETGYGWGVTSPQDEENANLKMVVPNDQHFDHLRVGDEVVITIQPKSEVL